MENKVNMTNVTAIALLYNALANNSKSVSKENVNEYGWQLYRKAKYEKRIEVNFDIFEEEKDQNFYHIEEKNIILNDNANMVNMYFSYISYLPEELIKTSLEQGLLNIISVDISNLKFEKSQSSRFDVMKLYCSSQASARDCAYEILTQKGYKNISVIRATPTQLSGDKGFEVQVSYIEEKTYLDIDKIYDSSMVKGLKKSVL